MIIINNYVTKCPKSVQPLLQFYIIYVTRKLTTLSLLLVIKFDTVCNINSFQVFRTVRFVAKFKG
jgi:hypothetical protein